MSKGFPGDAENICTGDDAFMNNQEIKKKLQYLQVVADIAPVRWFLDNQQVIARVLFYMFIAGCGYWVYHMIITDAALRTDILLYRPQDTRDALVFTVFGIFGGVIGLIFILFMIKLLINAISESIDNRIPSRSSQLVKSLCCLSVLWVAFIYLEDIKSTGLTAYGQVSGIVGTARQHDEVAAEKFSNMVEMIKKVKKGDLEDFISD